jgi:hypothetical protein
MAFVKGKCEFDDARSEVARIEQQQQLMRSKGLRTCSGRVSQPTPKVQTIRALQVIHRVHQQDETRLGCSNQRLETVTASAGLGVLPS